MLASRLAVLSQDPLKDAFHEAQSQTPKRVLLLCPPFQALRQASLAIAQLATLLRSQDIECAEAYVHFDFARCFSEDIYSKVVNLRSGLESELLFAEALHSTLPAAASERLDGHYGSAANRRGTLEAFAELCLEHVRNFKPDIVGSTTSFNQLLASLWLVRIIKREFPNVMFVLGGAPCAEPMAQSILKGYPEVDLVVSGFGEYPLLKLGKGALPRSRLVVCDTMPQFDSLPIPDYHAAIEQAGTLAQGEFNLSFESSRGCWWGQKNHCTFCGLNGNEMRFNAKSSARVVQEVRALWDTYGRDLFATDNILALDHLREAIVELGRFEAGPIMLYEVKANLTQPEVAALRRSRVRHLQPGIESLNTHCLQLIKKGTTAIRNLALLKWCREYGIIAYWNLLCGIPGEKFEDYDQQLYLMDSISHFQPPMLTNPLRIDRFSPYFKRYADFGWDALEPFEEYRWHHPHLDEQALFDIAYHFNGIGGVKPGPYLKRIRSAAESWRERFDQNEGLFFDPDKGLVRNGAGEGFSYGRNPGLEQIIQATHDIRSIDQVIAEVGCSRGVIEKLAKGRVLYIEGDKVINLAVRTRVSFDEHWQADKTAPSAA